MQENVKSVLCPNCNVSISIDDVLSKQIEANVKLRLQHEQKAKENALDKRNEELNKLFLELTENKKNFNAIVSEEVTKQVSSEKSKIAQSAKIDAEREQSQIVKFLEEQLQDKNEKLSQAMKSEVELRKEKSKLDEEKQVFELEKLKQLEEAKITITQEANKKAVEEQKYIFAQLEKKLNDALKVNQDLTRKLEQGSQKTQGEVLELELEDILKEVFPYDDIIPVPTGVKGADIIHKVNDRTGRYCGQIVWETKKTKSWNEQWIQKLKDDQRASKADLAVIVSAALPDEVKGFTLRDGVWICDINMVTALAISLRINLEAVAREKSMSIGKNEKMEILYAYLTGIEFKQRVEAIVEAFTKMDEGLRKERQAYEKIWSEREKQLKKVLSNTVGMYGDLSGLITLPQIKSLELDSDLKEVEVIV